jgi:sugar-phosphatase
MRLRATGFPTPYVLVAAEDVRVGKPSPEGYELAASRLGLDPQECVVIEDTPAGISAGRAAGARTVALTTTFPASALVDSDMIVPSLASIRLVQRDNGIEIT